MEHRIFLRLEIKQGVREERRGDMDKFMVPISMQP